MNRSAAREATFKVLYSMEIQKDFGEEELQLFLENEEIKEKSAYKYITDTINGINENKEEIEKLIASNIKEEWNINRLSKIDLALLKLAIYEIIYAKVPYKVEINEVVELAKKYGEDNSKNFVNGLLASIVRKNNLGEETCK